MAKQKEKEAPTAAAGVDPKIEAVKQTDFWGEHAAI